MKAKEFLPSVRPAWMTSQKGHPRGLGSAGIQRVPGGDVGGVRRGECWEVRAVKTSDARPRV